MRYRIILYLSIVCFSLGGCIDEKKKENNLIQLDVSISYPEKEIHLKDIADIEYLQLEMNENFLFTEEPQVITTDKIIISRRSDGNILVFSRTGKPVSAFNHKGNGPEEYTNLYGLMYDEIADELFIRSDNKVIVYSITGKFRRVIPLLEGARRINEMMNYDAKTILLYDHNNVYPALFSFISKEDGSVIETIAIPKGKAIQTYFAQQDERGINILTAPVYHLVRYKDGYLLTEFSIDTVYFLSNEKKLSPALIRKPEIQRMDPVVYLNSSIEAGGYDFMSAVTVKNENGKLPRTYLNT